MGHVFISYRCEKDQPHARKLADLVDMAGNVLEWCTVWFDKTQYEGRAVGVVEDPEGPWNGKFRVLRGRSFYNYDGLVRPQPPGLPSRLRRFLRCFAPMIHRWSIHR